MIVTIATAKTVAVIVTVDAVQVVAAVVVVDFEAEVVVASRVTRTITCPWAMAAAVTRVKRLPKTKRKPK